MTRARLARTLLGLALLSFGASSAAQDEPATNPEEQRPWALGLGIGLARSNDQGNLYYSANLRRRIHFKSREPDSQAGADAPSGVGADPDQGRRGRVYVEPEVAYWKRSEGGLDEKDLLVGLSLVGVVPTRAFDLFLGAGFGAHFHDRDVREAGIVSTESATRFGANVQFGVEADLVGSVGIFGAGRVDIVEDRPSQQSKVWGGLRFRF